MARRKSPNDRRPFFADGVSDPGYTPDQVEFMMAVESFKRRWDVPHLTCADVLEVARGLGYRRMKGDSTDG